MTDFRSNIPQPGEIVTVTTRRYSYILGQEEYSFHTYKDVKVLEPAKWDPPNTFRVENKTPYRSVPERTLSIINIAKLKRGNSVYTRKFKTGNLKRTKIKVTGSTGNEYTVALENNIPISCTCPGFHFRKNCRHLQEASKKCKSYTQIIPSRN